jgi:hypothetical protein
MMPFVLTMYSTSELHDGKDICQSKIVIIFYTIYIIQVIESDKYYANTKLQGE